MHDAMTPEAARALLALDDDALKAQCDESFFVGPGPGGQHRNKTSTAVRLVHEASGITVVVTENRSQWRNRQLALERLRDRLRALTVVPVERRATRPSRGSKRRRLEAKRQQGDRKRDRKVPGDV